MDNLSSSLNWRSNQCMERKRMDCPALPKGWKREEVTRKSGLSAGKSDVYYYSPSGKKFRSKPQLARYLGDTFDLSCFDFRTGKMLSSKVNKNKKVATRALDSNKKYDASLVLPIRQTASIFKQPVTHVRSKANKGSETRNDPKSANQEQPKQMGPKSGTTPKSARPPPAISDSSKSETAEKGSSHPISHISQLFWEKRLQGMNACDIAEEVIKNMELPKSLEGLGPGWNDETLLQSIASSLHLSNNPITGQTTAPSTVEKNPAVWLNTDQPLMKPLVVSDEDIRKQEERVRQARKRLEEAIAGKYLHTNKQAE
ncbi:PREDICTED: methyl-CpG-binding domain protein 3-like isoform X1 [Branchiostoma belcheri]|uniref:Methyl-CpG-binding domain protein 3-like isoform X1 n=1 Tax=Branchiostoma belcheri TaxID=7741 RepID=A0A6P4XT60_BRABE|nr:PREDICTED: methyl-CpG-binding domain protein 3-like isoform X1 [Branchiostoma belcheri]